MKTFKLMHFIILIFACSINYIEFRILQTCWNIDININGYFLHYLAGIFISFICYVFFSAFSILSFKQILIHALLIGITVGVLKEVIIDPVTNGDPDFIDALCTGLGSINIIINLLLLTKLRNYEPK